MNPEESIKNALPLLNRLKELLLKNKGRDLIAGIELVITQIQDENLSTIESLSNASRTYKGLMGGAGTLGDFVIWNPDPEICQSLNNELEMIFGLLWNIFKF
jgi:hypothetical protein